MPDDSNPGNTPVDDLNSSEPQRAALGAVDTGAYDVAVSLDELAELAATAGIETVARAVQNRASPDHATYFGAGKLEEIKEMMQQAECNVFLCDEELSPAQQRRLEKEMGVRVMDRTMLILDIFAARAKSSEGKLQVELATLKYSLPRLTGQWMGLSRQAGGHYARGAGESKLETDRRYVRVRIHRLEQELAALQKRRELLRGRRNKSGVETVVIVGYTNAGKSTLMNALTRAGVLAEDKLFATLDPTARALRLPDGRKVMLIDTVGLVRRLPHHLVEAFRSTLEEATSASLILNVCDASSPECAEHLRVTADLMRDLGCDRLGVPVLRVLNKCDQMPPAQRQLPLIGGSVLISALKGDGLGDLLERVAAELPLQRKQVCLLLPYALAGSGARFREEGRVLTEEFREDGIYYEAILPLRLAEEMGEYWV
ncbi:MAG: GTPase HflX [Oscillospiraceae bacterium]|jgi:GTP-binding protein HflX|nr:GTPase HflX [Oscillospiraceae bacterium]